MRIFILLAAVVAVSQTQTDCSRGACYPPRGDLLLGRDHRLHASSTCGLLGSEIYCTPYQQRRMKCCPCDSRNPKSDLAHTVQDVLSTAAPDRWWQSKKEVSPVTLQLDLEDLFQLENLVLNFKGPRPNALVIERTLDHGSTWQPALYLAADCQKAFPGVRTTLPRALDETYCSTLPPTGTNPYQDYTMKTRHCRDMYRPVLDEYKTLRDMYRPVLDEDKAMQGHMKTRHCGDMCRPVLDEYKTLRDMYRPVLDEDKAMQGHVTPRVG
ncbi:laminin subunit beta-3-like [Thalassophryne amazonica]|uniref:laminin subunit beta-3-like n=1 Tax=Thalassophryne amazonica TaxID=390379 RepID=UPI0014710E1A|nr:laminin subunit beta-3-like [Thalassophryne amazonica]